MCSVYHTQHLLHIPAQALREFQLGTLHNCDTVKGHLHGNSQASQQNQRELEKRGGSIKISHLVN